MRSVILIFLFSLGILACAQSPQKLVQDAIQKQRAGKLEEAVAEYRQFLKSYPDAAAIHSNLGAALVDLGRFQEAIPEYEAALKLTPTLAGARLNLALAFYKMGRITDASLQLEKVYREDPSNHQAALLLADCYLRMGRNDGVIRVLDRGKDNSERPGNLLPAGNGVDPRQARGSGRGPGRQNPAQRRLGRGTSDAGRSEDERFRLCGSP